MPLLETDPAVWQARFEAAQKAMSIFVPFLYGRAWREGLSVSQGVARAIRTNLTYAEMSRSSEFLSALTNFRPIILTVASQYRGADLRPGESISDVADWVLDQLARMEFTFDFDDPSTGPRIVLVRGVEIYATVINLDGRGWWRQMVSDLYAAFGSGHAPGAGGPAGTLTGLLLVFHTPR